MPLLKTSLCATKHHLNAIMSMPDLSEWRAVDQFKAAARPKRVSTPAVGSIVHMMLLRWCRASPHMLTAAAQLWHWPNGKAKAQPSTKGRWTGSPDALTELPASPLGRLRSTGNVAAAGGGVACASCALNDAGLPAPPVAGAFAARAAAVYPLFAGAGCVPCAAAAAWPLVAGGFGT